MHVRERPHRDGDEYEEDGEAEHRAVSAAAEHRRPEDDREEAHHRPGEEDAKHEEEGFHGRKLSNGARAGPARSDETGGLRREMRQGASEQFNYTIGP